MPVYTVTQLAGYLRASLEADDFLADLWLSGEVSNLSRAASGHTYFTLKDAAAQLRCVMFRNGSRGADLLQNGAQVMVHGRVSFYERGGEVNMRVDVAVPEGTGELHLRLEQLKARLETEGLFDPSRKRPLPAFPRTIGVVTSAQGAVFHDICNILRRRYPLAQVVLAPTAVQGDGAAPQIVAAIAALNNLDDPAPDVIIVARGGGSLEDLWPFNEETVARAIYASRVPVVSAVGHETDWTIADLVADRRAPTPSAAAELVTPDVATLRQEVAARQERAAQAMRAHLSVRTQEVAALLSRLRSRGPDVDTWRRRVDDLLRAASLAMEGRSQLWTTRVEGLALRLHALHPRAILERGYAVVQRDADGAVVSRTSHARHGDALRITVADGAFPATAGAAQPPPSPPQRKPAPRKVQVYAGKRLFE